jgi:3-aminobutyryl-CoA ammonia-lyase
VLDDGDDHAGRPSQRNVRFEARVLCRADQDRGPSAARVLEEPLVVVTADGTVVARAA